MIVGYVQTHPVFGEKELNFEKIEKFLINIKADLIVLPELFATGYTFTSKREVESYAEDLNGSTAQFLNKLAREKKTVIVGGFIEKHRSKIFNSAMIVSENGVIGSYKKIHLYYKEKMLFEPGDQSFKVFNVNNMKIGIIICFDWFFPESIRSLALLGAEVIAHPANLVLPYCQKAMVTRCLENRVFVITSNRIGRENRGDDEFKFTGCSQITSFDGRILSSAPSDKVFVDVTEIDNKKARDKNLNDFNHIFNDRTTKLYSLE